MSPTKKGEGEVYFEFERHSKNEEDSHIYVFNDFLDVTGENCKRLMNEPASMVYIRLLLIESNLLYDESMGK